jgi:hypothetical protein
MQPTQYGSSQLAFIKKVRGEIDKNKSTYFHNHAWHNITPNGGRFDSTLLNTSHKKKAKLESFYVKPIASWVPHLLFSNHVPSCPHCRRKDYVAVDKGRWINSPKVMFGLHRHKYLDTWLYPCRGCGRSFAGYNKQSMHYHTYHRNSSQESRQNGLQCVLLRSSNVPCCCWLRED